MIEATTLTFDSLLENDLPILVDFWAEWCGPCRKMAPILEEVGSEYKSVFITAKLNSDDNSKIALEHAVSSIPTLILFSKGKEIARMTGAKPKPAILAWLKEYVDF